MFALDPSINGFDLQQLKGLIVGAGPTVQKPRIALCSQKVSIENRHLGEQMIEEELNSGGRFSTEHTVYELAYVINRLLHPKNSQRRKHPRALTRCNVEYFQYKEKTKVTSTTFTISMGGLFIETDNIEPKRTHLNFKLYLDDGEKKPIECAGRVVYNHLASLTSPDVVPQGMGVRFRPLTIDDEERLDEFIYDRLMRVDQLEYQ